MLKLLRVDILTIQHLLVDFQKHSKCYELPPDDGKILGIYNDNEMIGYFIVVGYGNILEVNQGYLIKKYRHINLSKDCMELLGHAAKMWGFSEITLCTQNRFNSYIPFMDKMGYKLTKLIFSKEV